MQLRKATYQLHLRQLGWEKAARSNPRVAGVRRRAAVPGNVIRAAAASPCFCASHHVAWTNRAMLAASLVFGQTEPTLMKVCACFFCVFFYSPGWFYLAPGAAHTLRTKIFKCEDSDSPRHDAPSSSSTPLFLTYRNANVPRPHPTAADELRPKNNTGTRMCGSLGRPRTIT